MRARLSYQALVLLAGLVVLGNVVVLVGGALYQAGRRSQEKQLRPYAILEPDAVRDLEQRYGPPLANDAPEEWIVRDYFHDRLGGVFVDVGANDYRQGSTTYYLDTRLGWSGLAIEPQTEYAANYAKFRPRSQFVPLFVSDTSDLTALMYVPKGSTGWASIDESHAKSAPHADAIERLSVHTATLDKILDTYHVARVDFLSIDVEKHEPQVLRGFSVERFRPSLICIEAWPAVRQQILDYFAAHHYVIVSKYLRLDSANLWFAPLDEPR